MTQDQTHDGDLFESAYGLTFGFVFELYSTVTHRFNALVCNFSHDFFVEATYIYPFMGFCHFIIKPSYWYYTLILGICYLGLFVVIATLYYVLILPILLAWATVTMGPIGVIIVHIQWLLQSNAITVIVSKQLVMPTIMDDLFDSVLKVCGREEFLLRAKMVLSPQVLKKSWKSLEFWINDLPLIILRQIYHWCTSLLLVLISLIPLLGPTIVNQLLSPKRGYFYSQRYLKQLKLSEKQRNDRFYEHFGQYTAFGMMSGVMEFIPFISIITMTSNVVAGALWAADDIEKST